MKNILSLSVAFLLNIVFVSTVSAESAIPAIQNAVLDSIISDGGKTEFFYDEQGRLVVEIYTTNIRTEESRKKEYTYDENGNQLSYTVYFWHNGWVFHSKSIYSYDAWGNLLSETSYKWDQSTRTLLEYLTIEYTYDENGNQLSDLQCYSSGECMKWVYTYDAQGRVLSAILRSKDQSSEVWKERTKWVYTYDEQGNLLSFIGYFWISDINAWIVNFKYEYTYDENGNRLSMTLYYWKYDTEEWVEVSKEEYTYEMYGNLLSRTCYSWKTETNDWILDSQANYYYHYLDMPVPQIIADHHKTTKILHNGQVFILRREKVYTLTGQEVR